MYSDLNNRQINILEFIKEEIKYKGYPPTIREICIHTNLRSTSTVHNHLVTLEKKGYLLRNPTLPRAIIVRDIYASCSENVNGSSDDIDIGNLVNLPIISYFLSGKSLFDSDNISGYVPLPKLIVKEGSNFIFINQGNAMNKLGICHKDYVVINSNGSYEDGSLVLVLIHNEFTSIREYYRNEDSVTLKSCNTLTLDKDSVKVIGVVTGVFRGL